MSSPGRTTARSPGTAKRQKAPTRQRARTPPRLRDECWHDSETETAALAGRRSMTRNTRTRRRHRVESKRVWTRHHALACGTYGEQEDVNEHKEEALPREQVQRQGRLAVDGVRHLTQLVGRRAARRRADHAQALGHEHLVDADAPPRLQRRKRAMHTATVGTHRDTSARAARRLRCLPGHAPAARCRRRRPPCPAGR